MKPKLTIETVSSVDPYQLQIRNALRGLLILASIAAMYFARDFLLPVVLAVFIALTLKPSIRYLTRRGLPAGVVATVFLGLLVLSGLLAAYLLSGPIMFGIDHASQLSRTFSEKFDGLRAPLDAIGNLSQKITDASAPASTATVQEVVVRNSALPGLLAMITGYPMQILITLAATLVIAVFIMASGDLFYEKLVRVLPSLSASKRALHIVHDIESIVSTYVFTLSAINAAFAVLITLAFYLLGMPMPYLWGLLVFFLNFFPYVGAVSGIALSGFMAIVTFDHVGYALLVPLSYMILSLTESEIVRPQLLGRQLQMNAVAILLALAFFTWLWGISGAAMAVPLLVSLKVFCDHFEQLENLGEFIAARPVEKETVVAAEPVTSATQHPQRG